MLNSLVHRELWTSWASLLRSYAAAHGLNSTQHAVVEVGLDEIVVRVGSRWMRFTPTARSTSEGMETRFALDENGTVALGSEHGEEMDFAAERLIREMMAEANKD